jgi:hypothetical protein
MYKIVPKDVINTTIPAINNPPIYILYGDLFDLKSEKIIVNITISPKGNEKTAKAPSKMGFMPLLSTGRMLLMSMSGIKNNITVNTKIIKGMIMNSDHLPITSIPFLTIQEQRNNRRINTAVLGVAGRMVSVIN